MDLVACKAEEIRVGGLYTAHCTGNTGQHIQPVRGWAPTLDFHRRFRGRKTRLEICKNKDDISAWFLNVVIRLQAWCRARLARNLVGEIRTIRKGGFLGRKSHTQPKMTPNEICCARETAVATPQCVFHLHTYSRN